MILVKTFLAPDAYGGTGLFAGEFIPKGTTIRGTDIPEARLYPREKFFAQMSLQEYLSMPKESLEPIKKYVFPDYDIVNGEIVDLISFHLDNFSYLNHSETPNVIAHDIAFPDTYPLDIEYAACDIQEGEEMTVNYFNFHPNIEKFKGLVQCLDFLYERAVA